MYASLIRFFDFIEAILLNLVLLEILVKVLDPFESLPGRTVATLLFLGGAGNFHRRGSFRNDALRTLDRLLKFRLPLSAPFTLRTLPCSGSCWCNQNRWASPGNLPSRRFRLASSLYLTVQATTRFMVSIYTDPMLQQHFQ